MVLMQREMESNIEREERSETLFASSSMGLEEGERERERERKKEKERETMSDAKEKKKGELLPFLDTNKERASGRSEEGGGERERREGERERERERGPSEAAEGR